MRAGGRYYPPLKKYGVKHSKYIWARKWKGRNGREIFTKCLWRNFSSSLYSYISSFPLDSCSFTHPLLYDLNLHCSTYFPLVSAPTACASVFLSHPYSLAVFYPVERGKPGDCLTSYVYPLSEKVGTVMFTITMDVRKKNNLWQLCDERRLLICGNIPLLPLYKMIIQNEFS